MPLPGVGRVDIEPRAVEPVSKAAVSAPKARNVIAQGNALGNGINESLEALKARNRKCRPKIELEHDASNIISRFQRSEPLAAPPGPLAQPITFRAVGAETLGFHAGSKSGSCPLTLKLILSLKCLGTSGGVRGR
jgi:hypothetical protein